MKDSESKDVYLNLLTSISEHQKETQECVTKLDKKLDLNIQKIEYEIRAINRLDEHQNKLLDEHIQGVNTLKDIQQAYKAATDERIDKLEMPRKWWSFTSKIFVSISGIAAAVYGMGRIFGWF